MFWRSDTVTGSAVDVVTFSDKTETEVVCKVVFSVACFAALVVTADVVILSSDNFILFSDEVFPEQLVRAAMSVQSSMLMIRSFFIRTLPLF